MEVNNGGLCQFFVNSSRMVAPFVSEYIGIIGAVDHKKLYDDFISKYGIDLNDLSSFDIDEAAEFEEQNQRYPFDEYDDAFYDMEPLETYLKKFIRENIKDFQSASIKAAQHVLWRGLELNSIDATFAKNC